MKATPTTKEQLVYYMLQHISLGTYDNRFLTNLQEKTIVGKQPATSNQSDLLDKITLRYARQFRKKEIDVNDMVKLPWGIEPIESIPEYTDAFCTIKDGIIEVRSPYNKEFITEVKDTPLHLTWEKETKIWSAPVCEESLKHFINCLDKHYAIIHYCQETAKFISQMADYESLKCWDPTYIKTGDRYIIAGINESVAEATKNLELDLDPSTLARLVSYGVAIDDSVVTDAIDELWGTDYAIKLLDFITTINPIVDSNNLSTVVQYLMDIKCDHIVLLETFSNSKHSTPLKELLDQKKLKYTYMGRKNQESMDIDLSDCECPIVINLALWGLTHTGTRNGAAKTVFLGNNKPIEIK